MPPPRPFLPECPNPGADFLHYKEKDFGIAGEEAAPYLKAIADKL